MSVRMLVLILSGILLGGLPGCKWSGDSSEAPPPPANPPAATLPAITAQPASATVEAGKSATFNVVASGTEPLSYQWRRNGIDIAGATGATYTATTVAMADNGASFTAVVSNSAGSVTTAAAVLTVSPSSGGTASIALDQTTAMLTIVGQTASLGAHPVDSQGAPLVGAVTWTSSDSTAISVDAAGRVTAQKIGSAMLFAESSGVKSLPVFVFVAEPQPGSVLVTDAQVIAVGNIDANSRYDVTVSGITSAPAPGTVVLGTGDALVAGKVVITRPEAGNLVLTLELVAMPQLFSRWDIRWDIDLGAYPVADFEFSESISKAAGQRKEQRKAIAADDEKKHSDCGFESGSGTITPSISMRPSFSAARVEVWSSRLDPTIPPNLSRMAVRGQVSMQGSAGITVSAGYGGEGYCYVQDWIDIRVGGPLALLIMPSIRAGVRFDLDGRVEVSSAELTATGTLGLKQDLGFDCESNNCRPLNQVTLIRDFKLEKKVPSFNDMHVDLSGHLYAYVALDARVLLGLAELEIVEAKYGPKQTFDLAFPDDQAKNPSMASNYHLDLAGSIEPGADIKKAIKKFIDNENVSLNFGVPFGSALGKSPRGTLDISTHNVAFGKPVVFNVSLLPPLTYPFLGENFGDLYNVKSVKLYRKRENEANFTEWVPLPADTNQQMFRYEWTPDANDTADWQFAAFVETQVPILPVLEIEEDSVEHVHVRGSGWAGNVTFAMHGIEVEARHETSPTRQAEITTTHEDSGAGSYELETPANVSGSPIMNVRQSSGTITVSRVEQTDANYEANGCNVVSTQNVTETQTGQLRGIEGTFAFIEFRNDGTYQLSIPHLTGPTSGNVRTRASDVQTGHPSCHNSAPTDTSNPVAGSAQTSILTVTGAGTENSTILQGTESIVIPGTPDREYAVSWKLQQ